jgi:hypothetical protein
MEVHRMETQTSGAHEHTTEPGRRKPYARPELVQYGALEEITRDYTDSRSCRTGACING